MRSTNHFKALQILKELKSYQEPYLFLSKGQTPMKHNAGF